MRENLILHALAMEAISEHGKLLQTTINAMYAPHYDVKKIKQVAQSVQNELWRLHQVGMLNLPEARRRPMQGSVDALVKIFQALQNSNFAAMILETHLRIHPQERPRG